MLCHKIGHFELHNKYQGSYQSYVLEVETFWELNQSHTEAACGTSGCPGTITNKETGQTENLTFFCEPTQNNDFHQVTCYTNHHEEYLLDKYSDNEYRVTLCNEYYKFVKLNDCAGCFCKISDIRDNKYSSVMGCTMTEKGQLHCMNGNVYAESYRPKSKNGDFENCVDLQIP